MGGGGWGSVIWRQPRPYCHKTILTSLLSREQSFTLISLLEVFLAAHFIQVRPLCDGRYSEPNSSKSPTVANIV